MKKQMRPQDLRILMMKWLGYTNKEIASIVDCAPQTVTAILNREGVSEFFEEMKAGAYSSMMDVQQMAQTVAPIVLEEQIKLALHSENERIRSVNCKTLLEIAGHKPVSKVQLERPDAVHDKYEGKSEEEIRAELLRSLKELGTNDPLAQYKKDTPTVH